MASGYVAEISPGTQLGRYVISEKIADGGMGTVYKALELSLERYVAIKVMHEDYADSPQHRAQFLEEARAAAGLRHRNIVPLYAVGEEDGKQFFAMALIEGETLEDLVARTRPLDGEGALWFMSQAVAALEYASRLGIIHLDIKPANFLVDRDHIVMLTDFGLAARHSVMQPDEEHELLGTPTYASPEHVLQKPADLRTDIYCLGATLFHMMTGRLPFDADTTEEVCKAHVIEPFPAQKAIDCGVSKGWASLMHRMMEKDPAHRFQTYAELGEALGRVESYRHGVFDFGPVGKPARRRAVPRNGHPVETLYGALPATIPWEARGQFEIRKTYTRDQVMGTFEQRSKQMALNALVPDLQQICDSREPSMEDLVESLRTMPLLSQAVDDLVRFVCRVGSAHAEDLVSKIELLGPLRVRNLGFTTLMLQRTWRPARPLDWSGHWQQAIAAGIASEMVADMLELADVSVPYAAGLCQDIGRMVFAELFPNTWIGAIVYALQEDLPLLQVEHDVFQMDHAELGAEWLRRNRLPRALWQAVHSHETPAEGEGSKGLFGAVGLPWRRRDKAELTGLLALVGSQVARLHGIGFNGDVFLDASSLGEMSEVQALWEQREAKGLEWADFDSFFGESFQWFPELSIAALGHVPEEEEAPAI